jgi:hypothetical protein
VSWVAGCGLRKRYHRDREGRGGVGLLSEIGFAVPCSLCSSLVSCRSVRIVGPSVLSKVMPCLSAVVEARTSTFGTPSPPSLSLQYSKPLGVLMGRWRIPLTWFRIAWSMPGMVVMEGVARTVL